jgi:hypothetical protein
MAGADDVVKLALKLIAGSDPQKTAKAYKLFKQREGKLYPLFVDANEEVPLNQWLKAKAGEQAASGQVKSKAGPLAYRPGWHAGDLPTATHIGAKSHGNKRLPPDTRRSDEVWAEVDMADDVDWQKVADERARITKKGTPDPKTAHITDQVPYGGFYRYKTSPTMQGNWMIGGDMRVNRVLTDDEVKAINDAAGVSDLPRRQGYGPGGWVDDVVKMAGKAVMGEGDNVTRLSDVRSARETDALIKKIKSAVNLVKSGHFQAGRQALINQKSLDLHKSGMLPLQQGTIVTPPSTWDMPGDWRVSGYWYDEKDPRRFGYKLQNESGQTYDAAASDPRAGLRRDNPYSFGAGFKAYAGPNASPPKPVAPPVEKPATPKPPEVLDAINKEYEDLFGSEDPFKPRAHGGRIAKGPGGWLDDVVKMAGKVISGEGDDAAKTGIKAYRGTPQPTEDLIDLFHGTTPEAFDAITSSGNIFGSSRFSPRRDVAETFAYNVGGDDNTVVKVKAPASSLMIDLDLPNAKLLTPDQAAAYLDKPDWTILDFIENGYSVGVPDTSVLSIDRAAGGRIAKGGGGGFLDDALRMAGKAIFGEGEDAAKAGIRAYQGSPHNFAAERLVRFPEGRTEYIVGQPDVLPDAPEGAEVLQDFPLGRMRMDKIGTGEGAQAYGHGLYKTQKTDIGRGYRDAIMAAQSIDPEIKIGKMPINDFYGSMEQRLARTPVKQAEEGYNQLGLLEDLAYGGDVLYVREKAAQGAYPPQTVDWFEKNIVPQFSRKGRLYEVNINADPSTDFINYDAPWEDQPQKVKDAFSYLAKNRPDGSDLARRIEAPIFAQEASDRGVKGIQFLDAGSRAVGEGTRNYVVFDDKIISIIRKYGIAGASAMLGYNLMEQLDPKQALAASMADQDYKSSRPQRSMGGNNSISGALNVARGLNGGE